MTQTVVEQDGKRKTFAICEAYPESKMLYERLIKVEPGALITYAELTKVIDADVQGLHRRFLQTARRMAMRENHLVFGTVRNEGLKRLDHDDIPASAKGEVDGIRRKAHRALRTLACSDPEKMSAPAKTDYYISAARLGMLHHASSISVEKRLEAKMQNSPQQLTTEDVRRVLAEK